MPPPLLRSSLKGVIGSSTESPSTESPSTESPSTESPSTEPPSTESPSTEPPSTESPMGSDQRTQARRRFYHIVNHFEGKSSSSDNRGHSYNRPMLVRLTYEYARSEESQDNFLRAFFEAMKLPIDGEALVDFDQDMLLDVELGSTLFEYAEFLMENFFIPLKAATRRTPQPSPAFNSAVERVGGVTDFAGTLNRVSTLRGACLVRDRYRCVVSRSFDIKEFLKRELKYGHDDARDDDGNLLREEVNRTDALEVAHILPHSLTRTNSRGQLDPSKQTALAILNMFDTGITNLIEGTDIDHPRNAITLTPGLHYSFGDFRFFFEPTLDLEPHTYLIKSFRSRALAATLPVTRTLYLSETIDPPSPRLLAIHRAIARILHLSAAGGYIDRILRDMEETTVRTDGTTELGRFVKLRLGGWLEAGG